MLQRGSQLFRAVALCVPLLLPASAQALSAVGSVDVSSPLGQFLSLEMTIDESTTTFELTGPGYSFFAFGFDTTTMFGYSLIVEGTHNNRTVVEQNLQGIGNPGSPQATQNIELISVSHDASSDFTTLLLERANHTGDPNDPDFYPSMTRLDVIWGYSSFASLQSPVPDLDPFHRSSRARLRGVGHNRRSRILSDGFAKTRADIFVTGPWRTHFENSLGPGGDSARPSLVPLSSRCTSQRP